MEELQLKYVEIEFDKQAPQNIGTEINISTKIDSQVGNLEYKFIVGRGGVWNTIQEFSEKNDCVWEPKIEGEYMVMVQAREKYGKKPLDYLAKEDYSIVDGEVVNIMDEELSTEKVVNENEVNADFRIVKDSEEKCELDIKSKELIENEAEFKNAITNSGDNVLFLEVKELSQEEDKILIGSEELQEYQGEITNKVAPDENNILPQAEDYEQIEQNLIEDIIIDKSEVVVG